MLIRVPAAASLVVFIGCCVAGSLTTPALAACVFTPTIGPDAYVCDSGVAPGLNDPDGDNTLTLPTGGVGVINGTVSFGPGADRILMQSGQITGAVSQGDGIDDFTMSGGQIQSLQQGDGYDTFNMSGGTIIGAFEDGDYAVMSGGTIGRVDMKLANNFFYLSGGQIFGNLVTGLGLDTIEISNGAIGGFISVGGANDILRLSGGSVGGEIRMFSGNDRLEWTGGGRVSGSVLMGVGDDVVVLRNLSEATLSATPLIDGDLWTDALTFDNTTAENAARYTNWESISLSNGSSFTLDGRALVLGGADTLGGTLAIDASSRVVVRGTAAVAPFGAGLAVLTNAGRVDMSGTGPTDRLTVTGNYQGFNGAMLLDSYLGSDGAASDRLVVLGGTITGQTGIGVVNAGGPGAATLRSGILVVEAVNGATGAGNAFALSTPVAAGAFEYLLVQGGSEAGTQDNWYLRSSLVNVPPLAIPPPTPQAQAPAANLLEPGVPVPLYRPEAANYAVLPPVALQLGRQALGTLDERRGNQGYVADPEQPGWLRVYGQAMEQGWSGTVAPVFDGQSYGLQAGFDLLSKAAGYGTVTAGLLGGVATMSGDVRGFALGWDNYDVGRLNLTSTQVGTYATYTGASGWYVDGVLMGSWLGGSATSTRGVGINLSGIGLAASLETGLPIGLDGGWTLEPQGQVIWQSVSLNPTNDAFSDVRFGSSSAVTGRLGLRLERQIVLDNGVVTPAVFANLWQDFGRSETTLGGNALETRHDNTALELGAGFAAELGSGVNLFGNASYSFGLGSEQGSSAKAVVGFQVRF